MSVSRGVRLLALVAALLPAAVAGQSAVQLRYDLEAGKTYRTRMVTEAQASQTVQGMVQETDQTTTMDMAWEVLERTPEGHMRIRQVYEAIQYVADGPMGHMEYDSADPPAVLPAPLQAYAAMVGAGYEMTIASDGSIQSMSGVDAFLEQIIGGMDLPPGPAGDMVRESLETQFGEEGMAEMLRSLMPTFPKNPVSPGDSWSHSGKGSLGIPLKMESTMTLVRVEGGVAYLETRATVTTDSTSVQNMGPMTQTFHLTGTTTGTTEIDLATGMPLRFASEGGVEGAVSVSGPMGNMEIPMTTRNTAHGELLSGR